MATPSESQNLLLKAMKSSFNNSSRSDVIVTVNGDKIHVSAPLLEVHAPTLFSELTVPATQSLSPEATVTEQQMASHLSSLISQTLGKRVVTIVDIELKKDVVSALLESMYDKPIEITSLADASDIYVAATRFGMKGAVQKVVTYLQNSVSLSTVDEIHAIATKFAMTELTQKIQKSLQDSVTMTNANDIHTIATKFGMAELTQKADKIRQDSVMATPTETFLEAYTKAMETTDPLIQKRWKPALIAKLAMLSQEKVLELTSKMNHNDIIELINSPDVKCEEDLVYEIVAKWCETHDSVEPATKQGLMSHVKL